SSWLLQVFEDLGQGVASRLLVSPFQFLVAEQGLGAGVAKLLIKLDREKVAQRLPRCVTQLRFLGEVVEFGAHGGVHDAFVHGKKSFPIRPARYQRLPHSTGRLLEQPLGCAQVGRLRWSARVAPGRNRRQSAAEATHDASPRSFASGYLMRPWYRAITPL